MKETDAENNVWSVAVEGGPTFSVTGDVARSFRTPLTYTVYFVQHRRDAVLLAAETLASVGLAVPVRAWPHPDQVAANAEGRLTPAQSQLIMGRPIGWTSFFLLWPVLVVVAGTAVPIAVDDGTEVVWTVTIASMVVAAWTAWLVWRLVTRAQRAAIVRAPEILTSTGEFDWHEAHTSDWRLPLPMRADAPPPEPGLYLVYWINAPGPTLLSAAPLTSD